MHAMRPRVELAAVASAVEETRVRRPAPADAPNGPPRAGHVRWVICALLFAATTVNYVDRQVLGILAPTLQHGLGWTEADYGNIVSWFTLAYGAGFLFAGRAIDALGTRAGLALALVAWSLASMGHALASTVAGFSAARFALGLAESANFPASIKTVAEWFPVRERALATGLFNAGTNVGAIVAPVVVPWIALAWGWRMAFVVTGAVGFLWLGAWLTFYRRPDEHPRVTPAELAYVRGDAPRATPNCVVPNDAPPVRWAGLLRRRQLWAVAAAKGLTDGVWYFYLFWLPKFLDARFGVKLVGLAAPLVAIYVLADVGSVGGGWLSGALLARGWTANRARKTAMLAMALLVVPTMFAPRAGGLWGAVALVALAAAAHQGWSANAYTLASDMFPRAAVASVIGIAGTAGALGGFLFQRATGHVLQNTHDYRPIFVVCGLAYVCAWAVVQLLAPRLEPVQLGATPAAASARP
ncbi:hexuronate transporter [Gemmatimonadetes bacterium T265]|nr:hexuronate transporter [Gemmatimonadetes bacterium T265]